MGEAPDQEPARAAPDRGRYADRERGDRAHRDLADQRGDDALDSPEAAHQLAKEVERVRGVGALFATGGDLQIALRRTQEPADAAC